jgi:hypothetical protein
VQACAPVLTPPDPTPPAPFRRPAGESGARAIAAAVTALLHDRRISHVASAAELAAFAPALSSKAPASGPADGMAADGALANGPASDASLARVLLFTDKEKTTVLYKALSIAYAGRLRFGQALKGEGGAGAAAERLGVQEYPTLVVIKVCGDTLQLVGRACVGGVVRQRA